VQARHRRVLVAIFCALHAESVSLRVTDLAERLGIDAPAVTRKAQRLERLGLVSRGPRRRHLDELDI
jgi:Mn-dependent DtxR family transcriptional regulator